MVNLFLSPIGWNWTELLEFDVNIFRIWFFLIMITADLTLFTFFLHAIRLKWEKVPTWIVICGLMFLLLELGLHTYMTLNIDKWLSKHLDMFLFEVFGEERYFYSFYSLKFLDNIILNLWQTIVGVFILYAYTTTDRIVDFKPIKWVIRRWQIIGFLGFFFGMVSGILVPLVVLPLLAPYTFSPVHIQNAITIGINYIQAILIAYNAFRYPESLLISEVQVIRACKIYRKFKMPKNMKEPSYWGFKRIKKYLDLIPKSYFEEKCI